MLESSNTNVELFAFDPAGNIAPVAASTANEHPNQPHQATESLSPAQQSANKVLDNLLKDYIGTHYEYDARGNMVKRIHNGQTTTFVWDNFNRMVQSNSQDVRTTYVYDALGRRAEFYNWFNITTTTSERIIVCFRWGYNICMAKSVCVKSIDARDF